MEKMWLFMCLLVVLGSQGIVVKCTAAIFFSYSGLKPILEKDFGSSKSVFGFRILLGNPKSEF